MDSSTTQISLSQALAVDFPKGNTCQVQLPEAICWGSVSAGGFVACLVTKYASSYASRHPQIHSQTSVRSAYVHFHRPIFPTQGPVTIRLHELSICRAWSTLSVEIFQGGPKMCVSAHIVVCNFCLPGATSPTGWQLSPPPRPVDLKQLSTHSDPNWACYHMAFHPNGFCRPLSYIQIYIPADRLHPDNYTEAWVAPGWDCPPAGSSSNAARWTTDMIQYLIDTTLPIPLNFIPAPPNAPFPTGSVSATLEFAAAQKKARDAGNPSWRLLPADGSTVLPPQLFYFTLNMVTEIKKDLPPEGVRWLYLRAEVRAIQDGRADMEVFVFDPEMELVALGTQVGLLAPAAKKERKSNL